MSDLVRSVDERTLHFGPWGLGGAMSAEQSERLLRAEMDHLQVGPAVPETVRSQFIKLKALYSDGLFSYDSFTRAERDAYRVLEVALKVRFLEYYRYRIPLVIADTTTATEVQTFEQVRERVARRRKGEGLRRHPDFDGSFASLMHWARSEGLFYGQLNRIRENVTVDIRNDVQHSEHDLVVMLSDALFTIGLHFQWIQRLWGYDTPGGNTYPGPVARTPWIVGLGPAEHEATWFPLELLLTAHDTAQESRSWYVVLATEREHLADWRPELELTGTPVDALWGPGIWSELCAAASTRSNSWAGDAVNLLDRLFFVRQLETSLDVARRPAQLLALAQPESKERWFAVRADGPGWARGHVTQVIAGLHRVDGPCDKCAAHTVVAGARRETVERLARSELAVVSSHKQPIRPNHRPA
jgi:hypothetical protein